ncbi:MAG TPA: hypothetical protein PK109_02650 [Candidatus Paceibacterota bacterium]|nr:hypothetical protein [Candidatus Paceibacterota bacterium]
MSVDAILYFLVLALWSGVISYLLLFKILPRITEKEVATPVEHHAPAPKAHHAPAQHTPRPRYSSHEGFRSFAKGEELTVEDIVKGLSGGR